MSQLAARSGLVTASSHLNERHSVPLKRGSSRHEATLDLARTSIRLHVCDSYPAFSYDPCCPALLNQHFRRGRSKQRTKETTHTVVVPHWLEPDCNAEFFPQTLRMGDVKILSTAERATFPSYLEHRLFQRTSKAFLRNLIFANNLQTNRAAQAQA